jgi:hypothetical protein
MSINKKIAELVAEAKKLAKEEENKPEDSSEEEDEVTDTKKSDDKKDEEDSETKKVTEAKKKKLAKESDDEMDDEESEDEECDDMQEHVNALITGENLSEEFKQKAATIFEAAVLSRVKQEIAKLDEAYEAKLNERVEEVKEGLTEKINDYLGYVVEQWMQQNELALESGMKSEILEGFVGGLKSLFERHYIDVPQEKFNVLESLEEQNSELRKKLDEQMHASVELNTKLSALRIQKVIEEQSVGLVDTDKEKFMNLLEELEYDNEESFAKKAKTIRESYFTNKVKTGVKTSVVTDAPISLSESAEKPVQPQMKGYLSILDNLK